MDGYMYFYICLFSSQKRVTREKSVKKGRRKLCEMFIFNSFNLLLKCVVF